MSLCLGTVISVLCVVMNSASHVGADVVAHLVGVGTRVRADVMPVWGWVRSTVSYLHHLEILLKCRFWLVDLEWGRDSAVPPLVKSMLRNNKELQRSVQAFHFFFMEAPQVFI